MKSKLNGFEVLESKKLLSNEPVVAVLDSGIDLNHAYLINSIWTNKNDSTINTIDNDNNNYIDDIHGWNFIDSNNNVQDNYGHGSHVAGIIKAQARNSMVKIMPLKVMNDRGIGSTSAILKAIDYVYMMKKVYGVNIVAINASWGGDISYSQVVYDKISKLNNEGIAFVVAAGNAATDLDNSPRYPVSYDLPNIITVGALSYDGISLANFSNYGKKSVDLTAPGSVIYSTLPYNAYGYLSGTSMAAPAVAGTIAVLDSIKPDLTMVQVKNIIFSSVDRIPELFGRVVTDGKLNLDRAMSMVSNSVIVNKYPVGQVSRLTKTIISGWAKDPDNNAAINIKLVINDIDKFIIKTNSDGLWTFSLRDLHVGNHVIKIKAQDTKDNSWNTIATTSVTIASPVVRVGLLTKDRIAGWAFSERSGTAPVVVRVLINNKIVASQWANKYRPALKSVVGSVYHGFNMPLSNIWFHKGKNSVQVQVFDPISKQVTVGWTGSLIK